MNFLEEENTVKTPFLSGFEFTNTLNVKPCIYRL